MCSQLLQTHLMQIYTISISLSENFTLGDDNIVNTLMHMQGDKKISAIKKNLRTF